MLPWECASKHFQRDVCGFQWGEEREKKNQHNFLQVEFISLLKNAIQLCPNHTGNFKEPCGLKYCKHFKFPKKMLTEEFLKKKMK